MDIGSPEPQPVLPQSTPGMGTGPTVATLGVVPGLAPTGAPTGGVGGGYMPFGPQQPQMMQPMQPMQQAMMYKSLPAFTSLELPMDAPWKRNLVLLEWTEMVCVQARSFSPDCGRYLRATFDEAFQYFSQRINPTKKVDPVWEDIDARLVALLMTAMPERVRTAIYRMKGSNSVLDVLCCMYATLNPGGDEESSSIVSFTRTPGQCRTAIEAREKVEDWIQARTRLSMIGYSDLAPKERIDALTEIVSNIFKTTVDTSHRWQLQRFSDASRNPTIKYCQDLEGWVLEELRVMENNELIRSATAKRNDPRSECFTREPKQAQHEEKGAML